MRTHIPSPATPFFSIIVQPLSDRWTVNSWMKWVNAIKRKILNVIGTCPVRCGSVPELVGKLEGMAVTSHRFLVSAFRCGTLNPLKYGSATGD